MKGAWPLVLLLASSAAGAEPARRTLTDTFGGSVNNLGVQQSLEARWTWDLSRSPDPLLADAHVSVGVTSHLSPAYLRAGGWAAWAPLSIVELRVGVEPVYYFGIVGSLIGFSRQDAVFDEEARRARRPDAISRVGLRLYAAPTLRARVGRVVASSTVELERWDVNAPAPHAYFYEPFRDTLLSSDGSSLWRTSTVVLRESGGGGRKLLAGLHHEFMRVRGAPGNDMHRLGPLAVWTLGDHRFGVHEPTLLLNVYYYLEDPYKRHEPGATIGVRFGLGR